MLINLSEAVKQGGVVVVISQDTGLVGVVGVVGGSIYLIICLQQLNVITNS